MVTDEVHCKIASWEILIGDMDLALELEKAAANKDEIMVTVDDGDPSKTSIMKLQIIAVEHDLGMAKIYQCVAKGALEYDGSVILTQDEFGGSHAVVQLATQSPLS